MEIPIVTIPSENKKFPLFSWKNLHSAPFSFHSPFKLQLADGNTFFAEKILRIIPKKRLVVLGTWQEKAVVAKLFFSDQRAKQHLEKEVSGIKLLRESRIPTPAVLYEGVSEDGRVRILIFEEIPDAKNLMEIWQSKEEVRQIMPILKSVIVELAIQHVFGIIQHDLHLKNFLVTEKKVYILDGAAIEKSEPLLSKKISMNHLALFLSQLGAGVEEYQARLFYFYAKLRGWLIKKEDKSELFYLIKQWQNQRWKKFEKKIFRDSSDFIKKKTWESFYVCNRQYALPEFLDFLQSPEKIFHHPDAVLLKDGRSSTVIRVKLDQREFVIKRYNLKNAWHRLRRCFRLTRAHTSWRLAHKLLLFSLPTAKPAAFIENKCLGLRGKSYYVTEYVPGGHAGDFFARHAHDEDKISIMVNRVAALLKSIAKLEITHGDLKMTNLLINTHEQPVLIDLDGAAEHLSISSLHSAWKKEIKRLLKNFHQMPQIKEKFQQLL